MLVVFLFLGNRAPQAGVTPWHLCEAVQVSEDLFADVEVPGVPGRLRKRVNEWVYRKRIREKSLVMPYWRTNRASMLTYALTPGPRRETYSEDLHPIRDSPNGLLTLLARYISIDALL